MSLARNLARRSDSERCRQTELALSLTEQLRAFEAQLDHTNIGAGELFAAVAAARASLDVEARLAQGALANLADVIEALVGARAKVIRAHAALAGARRRLDLDHLAMGDWPKVDPDKIRRRIG